MSRKTITPPEINPPSYLVDGDALDKWREIVAELQPDGLLRPGDEDTLAMYCMPILNGLA